MTKSDVTHEQARALIDRVSQELGLLVNETSTFVKVEGPTNKHRVYVQRSRALNRIDTTLPLQPDDPAYKQLSAPNGSVVCHVHPSLENLERVLRLLVDASFSTQVPNKPRPFAPSKAPASRRPRAVAESLPESVVESVPEGGSLRDRLDAIRDTARAAKIRRYVENHGLTEDDAGDVVDGKVSLSSFLDAVDNAVNSEALEVMREAGLEVQS